MLNKYQINDTEELQLYSFFKIILLLFMYYILYDSVFLSLNL